MLVVVITTVFRFAVVVDLDLVCVCDWMALFRCFWCGALCVADLLLWLLLCGDYVLGW